MSGNYLFDTNIIIGIFNEDKKIVQQLTKDTILIVPSIVLGELYFGAYKSSKKEENINRINAFLTDIQLLLVDEKTAILYGQIKAYLKSQGTPIPENDIWIGALTLQHQLSIVTRDKHFSNIPNITIVKW